MTAVASIGHVGITVPDLDAAVAWYGDLFGWRLLMGPVELRHDDARVGDQVRDVFGHERIAFRQAHLITPDGIGVELFEFVEPLTDARASFDYWRVGVFHLCVVAPDIDAMALRIEERGGRRRTSVREIFPGEPYRFCYCEDPFGNVVELATHSHAEAFGGREAY
jgi:catechol 2,3-dioxygenase-like lactoylglutathione lyase family enzyme